MKYEMVFGDQSLFDGAPSDSTHTTKGGGFYRVTEDGGVQYLSRGPLNGNMCECIGGHLIAERRIIAEPKRWTVEDKKAGRLPDVGAKVDGGKVVFVNGFNVVTELKSGAVIVSSPKTFLNTFKPIETPEEKARREEDEFVKLMIDLASENQLMSCGFKDGVIAAYRKLKGGE